MALGLPELLTEQLRSTTVFGQLLLSWSLLHKARVVDMMLGADPSTALVTHLHIGSDDGIL